MGRQPSLFVCYGKQELHRAMDGGGNECIEEGLRNGRWEVRIRGNVKKRGGKFFLVCNFSCCCNFHTTKLVVDELHCADDLAK